MGVRSIPPEIPDILEAVETMEAHGLPLLAGGLLDQPHIWLIQVRIVKSVRVVFEAVNRMAEAK